MSYPSVLGLRGRGEWVLENNPKSLPPHVLMVFVFAKLVRMKLFLLIPVLSNQLRNYFH